MGVFGCAVVFVVVVLSVVVVLIDALVTDIAAEVVVGVVLSEGNSVVVSPTSFNAGNCMLSCVRYQTDC